MQRLLFGALAALGILSAFPHAAFAQPAWTNGTLEWYLRPGVPYVHNDGAPFTEVYNFKTPTATPLLFGANPNQLWFAYNMDRLDRAMRFGYDLPPGFDVTPPPNPAPRRFRLFRRHWAEQEVQPEPLQVPPAPPPPQEK